jgi:hypothetical protein
MRRMLWHKTSMNTKKFKKIIANLKNCNKIVCDHCTAVNVTYKKFAHEKGHLLTI